MTSKDIKICIVGLLFLILIFLGISDKISHTPKLYFEDVKVNLIIADTEDKKEKGLGGFVSLRSDNGMLFVFSELGIYSFWMKDMQFPIDIIWLDEKCVITHIENNISPETYPTAYSSNSNSLYVLEIGAGFVKKNNLKVGDTCVLQK
ncbi:MAG: DUF192 domain-containing protein [Patescibacteria group bacterium]|nr:DUF192 domain-containing protein [Patescibacteria group bacterium]